MESPAIDSCLAGAMGVACRSPLGQWPSPPAAHAHHNANTTLNGSSHNTTNYMGFSSPASENENSDSMMSDCSPVSTGAAAVSATNNTTGGGTSKSGSSGRQNQVGTIMLHGVAIVSLVIDNKVSEDRERLCLAQISNTLLKDYSYNEIHNRRVALGITCVQCTPVQLEILRRAGAMPVSSRRCGMITKREAERLVKSFLEENTPPKLPEDFAFDVHHECGWGCRGFFEPSRYNSSRAKCIKCTYCNMYFSPNKFIFHFHRTPDSKYNHPDAANFNSWRRHLKLYTGHDNEEIAYKWEDVKAMFNGGTRKRVFSSSSSSSSTPTSSINSTSVSSSNHSSGVYSARSQARDVDCGSGSKKAKTTPMIETNPYLPKPPPFSNPFNPYSWLATAPGKAPYPFMAMNSPQSMCFGFPPQAAPNKDVMAERMKASPMAPGSWMGRSAAAAAHFPLSSMDLFWDKAFGFPQAALGFRNGSGYPSTLPTAGPVMSNSAASVMDNPEHLSPHRDTPPCTASPLSLPQNLMKSAYDRREKVRDRMSAFKRVVPTSSSPSSNSLSPHLSPGDDHEGHVSNDYRQHNEDDDDGSGLCAQDLTTHKDVDDTEEIDVEEDADEKKRKTSDDVTGMGGKSGHEFRRHSDVECENSRSCHSSGEQLELRGHSDDAIDNCDREKDDNCNIPRPESAASEETTMKESERTEHGGQRTEHGGQDSGLSDESDTEADHQKTFVDMNKDPFRDEVNREKSFREHMSQQLELLRETLTSELEQERKIRFALQQKLKEAQDALQNFSCGILTGRRDMYSLKDTAVPR